MSEVRIKTAVTETLRAMAATAQLDAYVKQIQLQIERDQRRVQLAAAADRRVGEAVKACETEIPEGAQLIGIEEGYLVYSVPDGVDLKANEK